jgi:hypothetical protein
MRFAVVTMFRSVMKVYQGRSLTVIRRLFDVMFSMCNFVQLYVLVDIFHTD